MTDFSTVLNHGGVLPNLEPAVVPLAGESRVEKLPAKPRRASRFSTLNDFVDNSAQLLSVTAQAAWYVIYRDVKANGLACLAHSQIAEKMGVVRRTATRALQELESKGLITVVKRGGLNRGSNVYRVHGKPRRVSPRSSDR